VEPFYVNGDMKGKRGAKIEGVVLQSDKKIAGK